MGMAYTFFLKSIFLADAITISVNFVFRAIAGAISISVIVSSWLIVCTFLLAMTLIFGKRKAELAVDNNQRIVLKFYTKEMLSGFSLVSIASLFISYSIYTISHSVYMPTTLPLAAFLLFRYMSFLYSEDRIIENAENLLRDRQLLFGSALWVFVVMIILYAL
jgi:4-hydroxybenzoate polyprenyltransferase